MFTKRTIIVLITMLALFSISVSAQDMMSGTANISTVQVTTHPSQGDVVDVEGATATLVSTESGIAIHFAAANLEENHAYTMWVAIINAPDACSSSPCTGDDVLGNPDALQSEMALGANLLYHSSNTPMTLSGFIPVGDVAEGWFGNGLTNPLGAEVHVVLQDHGDFIPEMASTMLNTVRGGCTDESVAPPYPDHAKVDGDAGPNTCRGIQLAIFVQ